jgi:hypothetical protein
MGKQIPERTRMILRVIRIVFFMVFPFGEEKEKYLVCENYTASTGLANTIILTIEMPA